MSSMIDRNKYANLAEALADVTDISKVVRAVVREVAIREMMAESGETREVVTSVADAAVSMDEEAVLSLMDGEPTTLHAALERLAEGWHRDGVPEGAEYELDALLKYPWPSAGPTEEELTRFRDDVDVTLRRKLQPLPGALGIGVVAAEIEMLVKDRFFPDR